MSAHTIEGDPFDLLACIISDACLAQAQIARDSVQGEQRRHAHQAAMDECDRIIETAKEAKRRLHETMCHPDNSNLWVSAPNFYRG